MYFLGLLFVAGLRAAVAASSAVKPDVEFPGGRELTPGNMMRFVPVLDIERCFATISASSATFLEGFALASCSRAFAVRVTGGR